MELIAYLKSDYPNFLAMETEPRRVSYERRFNFMLSVIGSHQWILTKK